MDLETRAAHLAQLMEERLSLRGRGFANKLARAGRRLPRRLRREGAVIAEALAVQAHPKLARRLDQARFQRAADQLERYLRGIDPAERRKGLFLNWLAGVAFSLLLVLVILIAVLRARGLI